MKQSSVVLLSRNCKEAESRAKEAADHQHRMIRSKVDLMEILIGKKEPVNQKEQLMILTEMSRGSTRQPIRYLMKMPTSI